MENRKISELKDYPLYLAISSNPNYRTDFDQAMAMLKHYCNYGKMLSAINNSQKHHAKPITGIIDYYALIKVDSIARSIEYLLYLINKQIGINTISAKGDLHTILFIISTKMNINIEEYKNNNFINEVDYKIDLCTSWLEAFYQNQLYVPASTSIMNKLWIELKNDVKLIEKLGNVHENTVLWLITNDTQNVLTDDKLKQLYKNSLLKKHNFIAAELFCKLNSIQKGTYVSSNFNESLVEIIKESASIIPSDLLVTYLETIPAEDQAWRKTAIELFLNLYPYKNKFSDWDKFPNKIKQDFPGALLYGFCWNLIERPANSVNDYEILLESRLLSEYIRDHMMWKTMLRFLEKQRLNALSRWVNCPVLIKEKMIDMLKILKVLVDHDFKLSGFYHIFNRAMDYKELKKQLKKSGILNDAIYKNFKAANDQFEASIIKAKQKFKMFHFFMANKQLPFDLQLPNELVKEIYTMALK